MDTVRPCPAVGAFVLLMLLVSAQVRSQTTAGELNDGNRTTESTPSPTGLNMTFPTATDHGTSSGLDASTTGLPDVTATSQRILLLTEETEGRNASETAFPTNMTAGIRTNSTESSTEPETSTVSTSGSPTFTSSPSTASSIPVQTHSWSPVLLELDNVTENATTEVEQPNIQKIFKTVLLTFNGSCRGTASSIVDRIGSLAGPNGTKVDPGYVPTCTSEVRVRLMVSDPGSLPDLFSGARIDALGAPLTLARVDVEEEEEVEGEHTFVTGIFATPLTTREIATYAIVGAIFGLAIVIVSGLLCCKCCCGGRRRKASRDIPRLAMRLEDYSLTRIPRPSTLFGSRNGSAEAGRSQAAQQSFETSVVPLDEEFGSVRQGQLRSFSGRRSRAAAGRTELDGHSGGGSPALYGSSERLAARDLGKRQDRRGGTDNHMFRF